MRTLRHVLYYPSRSDRITLYNLTDLHIGAAACNEKLFLQKVEEIAATPHTYWVGGGDYVDAIARVGDKRYHELTIAPWLYGKNDVMGHQRDRFLEMVEPIADKCLGLVSGNHEFAAERWYDRDLYWEIVTGVARQAKRDPGELALGVGGFLVLRFRRGTPQSYGGSKTITIFITHGWGGGRLPGGHALTLGRTMGDYAADLILMGHRHVQQLVIKTITVPSGSTAKVTRRYGVYCGTYLGAYVRPSDGRPVDTYPEHKGLPPSPVGTPTILVKPDQASIQVLVGG